MHCKGAVKCALMVCTNFSPPPQPTLVVPEEATPDSIEILASARRRDHAVFQWDEDQRNAAADSSERFPGRYAPGSQLSGNWH